MKSFVVLGLLIVAISAGFVLYTGWQLWKATPPKRGNR